MTSSPAIKTDALRKSYGEQTVLAGVDLDVPAGTVLALLGANGAGKTTLVKILSTLLKADCGHAVVAGHDVVTEPGAVRASISLTGQFAAVDEVLTGRENLVLVAQLRHVAEPGADRRRPARAVRPDRGRPAAGRDLLRRDAPSPRHRDEPDRRPPVLFLDEPTTGLDPQARIEVWNTVQAARRPRHHGAADDAVPRRGRAAGRPDRDPARGPDHRRTAPSPS